jgi:hypothetical protein
MGSACLGQCYREWGAAKDIGGVDGSLSTHQQHNNLVPVTRSRIVQRCLTKNNLLSTPPIETSLRSLAYLARCIADRGIGTSGQQDTDEIGIAARSCVVHCGDASRVCFVHIQHARGQRALSNILATVNMSARETDRRCGTYGFLTGQSEHARHSRRVLATGGVSIATAEAAATAAAETKHRRIVVIATTTQHRLRTPPPSVLLAFGFPG